MFDIGFPELLIVAVVALLVIGPDKLPETVRALALWVGRFKRGMASLRAEIEQEIGADDIRRQLHNEAIMKELEATRSELAGMANDTNKAFADIKQPLQAHHLTGDPELERVTEATLAPSPSQTNGPVTDTEAGNADSGSPVPDETVTAHDKKTPASVQHSHDRHE